MDLLVMGLGLLLDAVEVLDTTLLSGGML